MTILQCSFHFPTQPKPLMLNDLDGSMTPRGSDYTDMFFWRSALYITQSTKPRQQNRLVTRHSQPVTQILGSEIVTQRESIPVAFIQHTQCKPSMNTLPGRLIAVKICKNVITMWRVPQFIHQWFGVDIAIFLDININYNGYYHYFHQNQHP